MSIWNRVFSAYLADFIICFNDRDGKIMHKGTYFLGRSNER
ncbi:hypothetical protein MBGDF03_01225 [Thermoplasmatales archaeon SCGC AB-540-F20]|nr:hypothetical protein MBGDF03_01225 [Thermoplasmatales archaeon SCGC AB-540-F20]